MQAVVSEYEVKVRPYRVGSDPGDEYAMPLVQVVVNVEVVCAAPVPEHVVLPVYKVGVLVIVVPEMV